MKKLLHRYQNGNYIVTIFDDGTKIKETEEDEFISAFPESIDMKITNWCNMGCKFCHEKSNMNGKAGKIDYKFIETLRPGTELALGGGMVTSHPQLIELLTKLKQLNIIANITVHQHEFMINYSLIKKLVEEKLIHGLGVSYATFGYDTDMIKRAKEFPNLVFHLINGIHGETTINALADEGFKILLLGYKTFGRGEIYEENHLEELNINQTYFKNQFETRDKINKFLSKFQVVSFDNLAIKQLGLYQTIEAEDWKQFYQGDDGTHTMYIDLVEGKYGKNSISVDRFDIKETIDEMFQHIKSISQESLDGK